MNYIIEKEKFMTTQTPLKILQIDSSGRYTDSVSRDLTRYFADELQKELTDSEITYRDVAKGLPFIDETWITANFTPADDRTTEQKQSLALSDTLIQELFDNDIIIIGVPLYNFSIPATLKAWIDLVTRAQVTFNYTESGPVGQVKNTKAYLVVATGGTKIGSDIDFATGYLKHILSFIGITDVDIINADGLMAGAEAKLNDARTSIRHKVSVTTEQSAGAA